MHLRTMTNPLFHQYQHQLPLSKLLLNLIFLLDRCQLQVLQQYRLVFRRFLDFCGNLGNVREKPTGETCFSRELKRLTFCIYLVFSSVYFFFQNGKIFIELELACFIEIFEDNH